MNALPTTSDLVASVSAVIQNSDITSLFREAMILEVIKVARPLIEKPFRDELERLKGKVESADEDDDLVSSIRDSIEKLTA